MIGHYTHQLTLAPGNIKLVSLSMGRLFPVHPEDTQTGEYTIYFLCSMYMLAEQHNPTYSTPHNTAFLV